MNVFMEGVSAMKQSKQKIQQALGQIKDVQVTDLEIVQLFKQKWERIPRIRKVLAIAQGLHAFAWYSLPDFVVERKKRRVIKSCLSVGIVSIIMWILKDTYESVRDEYAEKAAKESYNIDEDTDLEQSQAEFSLPRLSMMIAVGGTLLSLSLLIERWLFRRGQSNAERGVKFAHTRQAIPMSILTFFSAIEE